VYWAWGVNPVILFDERVGYVKKVKDHWSMTHKTGPQEVMVDWITQLLVERLSRKTRISFVPCSVKKH